MKLTFRQRGLSSFIKKRLLLLSFVFITSLVLFIVLLNLDRDVFLSDNVDNPSLPTISIVSQGETYGDFFGYKTQIDLGRVRNGLIPLDVNRNIDINLNGNGNAVSAVSYELNTGDGNRRIAGGEIEGLSGAGQSTAGLSLSNLTEEGKEYMLTLKLETPEPLYYYMRVKYVERGYEKECLDFARYFMETALSNEYKELATYMEPKNVTRNGLSRVTINSSLNDVGWQGFDIVDCTKPSVSFAEIDRNYTALNLKYIVTGAKGGDSSGTYIVKEYYRMRHGEERIFLLDYERELIQLFDPQMVTLTDENLILGQSGERIEFLSNRAGTNVAFVWGKDLYEYNAAQSQLSKIFSFGPVDINDSRTMHDEYNIDILKIDENGNVDYSVYGYMNAGVHEGYCGIGLYHYDYLEDRTTEQAFISTDHSFTSLSSGFNGGIFLSSNGKLYVSVEGEIYRSDLETGRTETLISAKEGFAYSLSEEGRYLAYSNIDGKSITLVDLFSEKVNEIGTDPGKRLRVIEFMGEDLVYGLINEEDYTDKNREDNLFPMEEVRIINLSNEGGELLKSYSRPGEYVLKLKKESSYNVSLTLAEKHGDVFVESKKDSIQNTAALGDSMAVLSVMDYERLSKVAITFTGKKNNKEALTLRDFDKISLSYYTGSDIFVNADPDSTVYYAFRGMDVTDSSYFPGEAIKSAFMGSGYCVDNDGRYIWQYGRGLSKSPMEWQPESKEGLRKINLTGCDLEEVLSYVYRERPVYVHEKGENPLIIVGYDSNSVTFVNATTMDSEKMLIEDAKTLFSNLGKTFVCYIPFD